MSNWQIKILTKSSTSEITIYQNGTDVVKAKFTSWKGNTNEAEKIKITSSTDPRKILGANYCTKYDTLEIHYSREQTNDLGNDWPLTNCKIDCIRVNLVEYSDPNNYDPNNICLDDGITQPRYKKGNIVVGNS